MTPSKCWPVTPRPGWSYLVTALTPTARPSKPPELVGRLATIDTLAELIERGRALPATPIADSADDALALLIYTWQYRRT